MFWHLFSYRLKILGKNFPMLFWTMVFPILLGLLFTAAFSNLDKSSLIETTTVGIVAEKQDTKEFQQILREVTNHDEPLFETVTLTKKTAEKQLLTDELSGYYEFNGKTIELFAGRNGVTQAVLLEFLNQYLQAQDKVQLLLAAGTPPQAIAEMLTGNENFIAKSEARTFSQSNFYFFALLGMTIVNGLLWGLGNTNDQQANQSANGIRVCLSPQNKFILSLANLLASFLLFFLQSLVVLAVFHFVYQIDFGPHWQWILLLVALGVLNALSFGTLLGNLAARLSFTQKINIGTTLTMSMSFLAGMMGTESLKYWISQHLPLAGKINLVNLISESFYQLYYYQSLQPFFQNLGWLTGFTLFFFLINVYFERRVSYDHL